MRQLSLVLNVFKFETKSFEIIDLLIYTTYVVHNYR